MARPQDKTALLAQSAKNYQKLRELVDNFTEEQQAGTFPFEDRDRNIRDVLIHLYEWHQLYLNWLEKNTTQDQPVKFLPEPYTFKTTADLNHKFWEMHQETPLAEAKKMLDQSHAEVLASFEKYSDEELFTKKYFPWTGTTSLGSYGVSAASSHYDWALKKIRKYQKTL